MKKFILVLLMCFYASLIYAQTSNKNVVVSGTEWVQSANSIDMRSDSPKVSETNNKIKFTDETHLTVTLFGGMMVIIGTYEVEGNKVKVTYSDGGKDEWLIEGDTLNFDNGGKYTKVDK
jgi:hypothetical protein